MHPFILAIFKRSRDAAIFACGIVVFVWAFEKLNPSSLITAAEGRQMRYVDERLAEKERLDLHRHEEQLRAVQRIDSTIQEINRKLDRLITGEQPTSTRR